MSVTFLKHFDSIIEPHIERYKKHEFIDILLLTISAVLSGAKGQEGIEGFGHLKLDWLIKYDAFKEGISRHYTIARVICRLKVDEIQSAFQSWISLFIETTSVDIIAIDGNIARRSFTIKDRESLLHTVSVWSCPHQLVLGQTVVDSKINNYSNTLVIHHA